MSFLSKIYAVSPVFIQNVFISLYGYYWKYRRYGGNFKVNISECKNRENYTATEWENYQTVELRKLLIHAFETVPFYNKLYSKSGFNAADFKSFELSDLKKLPCLSKDDVRKFGTTSLLSSNRRKGNFYNSSGSTGTPVKIFFSKEVQRKWNALFEARVRNWAGVNHTMSRAMIGGRRVLPKPTLKSPYYRINKAESQIYFSAYHITANTAPDYLSGLKKHKPDYLIGYAVSIYLLSKFIIDQKLNPPILKAVLTSSEKLTEKMRLTIEKAFKCKVFDAYSGMEACGLISENRFGELLFSPDSGIMEVLDEDGNEVKNGTFGEVIATGFLNYDQPLIRYRIGDRVTLTKDQKAKSGVNMPVVEAIEGRIEDTITGINGNQMVRFHSVFAGISSIVMAQVVQESLNKILVKLVVDKSYNRENEQHIKNRIRSQLGAVTVNFEYLTAIEQAKNGKFKAVISNLNNEK